MHTDYHTAMPRINQDGWNEKLVDALRKRAAQAQAEGKDSWFRRKIAMEVIICEEEGEFTGCANIRESTCDMLKWILKQTLPMPRAGGMQQRYGCPGRPIGSKRKKRDFGEEILSETDPTMTGGETLGGLSSKAPPTPADEVCLVLRSATIPGIRVKRGVRISC